MAWQCNGQAGAAHASAQNIADGVACPTCGQAAPAPAAPPPAPPLTEGGIGTAVAGALAPRFDALTHAVGGVGDGVRDLATAQEAAERARQEDEARRRRLEEQSEGGRIVVAVRPPRAMVTTMKEGILLGLVIVLLVGLTWLMRSPSPTPAAPVVTAQAAPAPLGQGGAPAVPVAPPPAPPVQSAAGGHGASADCYARMRMLGFAPEHIRGCP